MIEGVEAESIKKTTRITKHLVKGLMPEPGRNDQAPTILLGAALAETLGAKEGDEISVISPFFEKESLQPRARRFRVSGILQTGMYDYDSKYSVIHADEARDFFRLPDSSASAFKIKTRNSGLSHLLAARLQKELGYPYRVRDWTELNRNLLYAIRLQKAVIFVILTAIIVVAAFNIMSTLMMMMSEKKKEMSILKAMGLSPRQSSGVFISVGLIIGISGAAAGVALGLGLGLILGKTRFIQLPPDIYFISYLPVDVRFPTLLLIAGCAVLVALLATLYPGFRVARESPVEGLRYE
jgi:lipoprotein-releasing system permease protein